MDRLTREKATVSKMIAMYCSAKHRSSVSSATKHALCADCQCLELYAHKRLDHCRWMPQKPTCSQCTTHCYAVNQKAAIRDVMKFAGPRMLLKHPRLALLHLVDRWRSKSATRLKQS